MLEYSFGIQLVLDRKPRKKDFQFYSGNFNKLILLDFFNPKSAIKNRKSCLNVLFVQALVSILNKVRNIIKALRINSIFCLISIPAHLQHYEDTASFTFIKFPFVFISLTRGNISIFVERLKTTFIHKQVWFLCSWVNYLT